MKFIGEVKVSKSVHPIHFSEREKIDLVVGGKYFVSFGCNWAHPCTLLEDNTQKYNAILIEEEIKEGKLQGTCTHVLFPDEVGRTPEEAVIRQVTS